MLVSHRASWGILPQTPARFARGAVVVKLKRRLENGTTGADILREGGLGSLGRLYVSLPSRPSSAIVPRFEQSGPGGFGAVPRKARLFRF
jgi:hypothetical protein